MNYFLKPYQQLGTFKDAVNRYASSIARFFVGNPKKTYVETPQITFLGATKTVTGSKYLLEYADKKILVDCGQFQGSKNDRDRNRAPLPIYPKNIDAIVLTHAHLDHIGYIPVLIKGGFKGKIFCTPATFELSKIILPDSGYLQEEDFRFAKKHNLNKLYDAEPLYTQKEAVNAAKYFKTINYDQRCDLGSGVSFVIQNAGHILGAGVVTINLGNKRIVFSGDLGRQSDEILYDPTKIKEADYIVCESTYGNKDHDYCDPKIQLEDIINKTTKKGGSIIIPAFSVGRCQTILYFIHELKKENKIPNIPVFVDSPMSIKVTHLLDNFANDHKLSESECYNLYDDTIFTTTVEQSKKIFDYHFPLVVISASGMATGGRILHHLAHYAPDKNNSIVLTGFQASGTRGRYLADGKRELKIHGQRVPVEAKVYSLSNMSAHADRNEILLWLKYFLKTPKQVFVTHGEEEASYALADKIKKELNWDTYVPEYLETIQLL